MSDGSILAERFEDMSRDGRLRIISQPDGDVIVALVAREFSGDSPYTLSVEFCSVGAGGGRSPHTLAALRLLRVAIEKDNLENPIDRG